MNEAAEAMSLLRKMADLGAVALMTRRSGWGVDVTFAQHGGFRAFGGDDPCRAVREAARHMGLLQRPESDDAPEVPELVED